MSMTQTRWILASSLLGLMAGCDVTVTDCDEEPDAEICQDDIEDEDASGEEEVDADARDGGRDAGRDGGSQDAGRDGGSQDAGGDGGVDGSAPTDASVSISVDEFCVAQLATAVAWRDELEALCGSTEQQAREDFLQRVLAYAPDDAEGKCISARNAPIMAGKTTFDGSKAMACASAFVGNFMAPPSPFPTSGIDLAMYEAKIAHGAPALIQIPECRAAFKGKTTRGNACSDNFECVDGLRCLPAAGNTTQCQTALVGGTCVQSSNCADGYTCVGSTAGGGKTCVKSDALPLSGGNCTFSAECSTDYVCSSAGKCTNPVADVICD
jgi:hypothetical protein